MKFPRLHIHIFYDESFHQENKVLQKIYEDLGFISDENEYIEAENQPQPIVHEFINPYYEMYFVIQDSKNLNQTADSQRATIILANDDYREPLMRLICRQNMESTTVITSFTDWGMSLNSKVYVLGFCRENFSKVLVGTTRQIYVSNKNMILTRSQCDFKGKPTMAIKQDFFSEIWRHQPDSNEPEIRVRAPHRDYFKTKKKTFSISQIQEYLSCPYRYYASYHLGLDKPDSKDLEPDHDIKGSFTHRVLYRLIKENNADYLNSLEHKVYQKKLEQKLSVIIQEELSKDEKMKMFNQNLCGFYIQRVYKTIAHLMHMEAKNFKAGKKKTTPQYCEWIFDNCEKQNFAFDTEMGVIHLKGRIDRVDVNHSFKNFSVIDYKTGAVPTLTQIKSAQIIQLPLYLMAIKTLLYRDYQPAGAFYYALKENDIKGFTIQNSSDADLLSKQASLSFESWQEIETKTREQVNKAVTNICRGNFDPNPSDENLCTFCDYRRICGYRHATHD